MTMMTTPLLVHCLLAVFLALVVTAASNDTTRTTKKALTGRFIHVTGNTNNNKTAIDLDAYVQCTT